MKITSQLTDAAVLREIAARLEHARIAAQLTQAALATRAGVAKRTVERIEGGHTADFVTLIRLLRALELADGLETLAPPVSPGPIALLRHRGRERQRVSGRTTPSAARPARPWTWADGE